MLIIDLNKFSLFEKNEIENENGSTQYWSQPDFSYKRRVHIYDSENNEIGYVQYKILSSQNEIGFYDKDDKPIILDDLQILYKKDEWNYSIVKNNNEIVLLEKVDNLVKIEIKDYSEINKCLLKVFSLAEQGEQH